MIAVKSILVPMDFGEPALRALEYAKMLSVKLDAVLHVLHVNDDPVLFAPTTSESLQEEIKAAAAKRIEDLFTESEREQMMLRLHVEAGTAASIATRYAAEEQIDLIVTGTHARSRLSKLLMGSVAETILRSAPCPVMVVRAS